MENLEGLFNPRSVAVIGASGNPGKLGYHVMKSLTRGGFEGEIIPVNPVPGDIMGLKAYPSIQAFSGQIDLVVVVVPAKLVPGVFRECADKGVSGIVLITAGFKEIEDPAGADLHEEILAIAQRAKIPVIGPNTFGVINFAPALNASFTPEFSLTRPGNIALVSQSGGMAHLLGFLAQRGDVGLSKIVGLGNRLNVDFPEMLAYLMDDPRTKVIALYVEGLDRARELLKAARTCGGRKPLIAYKTGAAGVGDAASRSHTGSMAGRGEIYAGAFLQAGILPVESSEALLDGAKALSACPLLEGAGIAVLTAQAGPGMAASDLCESEGMHIASFSQKTQAQINACLPPLALRTNPVDMGPAWYDSEAIGKIVKAAMNDEEVKGILLLTMFASANVDILKGLAPLLKDWGQRKPVISCISAPPGIWDAQIRDLEESGALANYPTPERAAAAMAMLWHHRKLSKSCSDASIHKATDKRIVTTLKEKVEWKSLKRP